MNKYTYGEPWKKYNKTEKCTVSMTMNNYDKIVSQFLYNLCCTIIYKAL